jgi:hypothetical protein
MANGSRPQHNYTTMTLNTCEKPYRQKTFLSRDSRIELMEPFSVRYKTQP